MIFFLIKTYSSLIPEKATEDSTDIVHNSVDPNLKKKFDKSVSLCHSSWVLGSSDPFLPGIALNVNMAKAKLPPGKLYKKGKGRK